MQPPSASASAAPTARSAVGEWPSDGLESVPACPVCGEKERALAHAKLRDRVFFCAPGEWDLYRCAGCHTGYLDPRPDLATIGLAYSDYFTHSSASGPEAHPKSSWRRRRLAARNSYLNHEFGYRLEPSAARAPTWLGYKRRQRWEKSIFFLRWPGEGARLLDVGCGNGKLLLQMRQAGWQVAGVEPDAKATAQAVAANLDVRTGLLEADTFPAEHFDAVTMNHVIEHLHDPVRILRHCFRVLKPGGVIAIATPNLASLGHRTFGRDWFPLDPPRHLVLFTPDSLRAALKSAGLQPEPSLRLSTEADNIFRRSMHVRNGGHPIREQPPLARSARWKAAWQARWADSATRKNRELTEELFLLARRPEL